MTRSLVRVRRSGTAGLYLSTMLLLAIVAVGCSSKAEPPPAKKAVSVAPVPPGFVSAESTDYAADLKGWLADTTYTPMDVLPQGLIARVTTDHYVWGTAKASPSGTPAGNVLSEKEQTRLREVLADMLLFAWKRAVALKVEPEPAPPVRGMPPGPKGYVLYLTIKSDLPFVGVLRLPVGTKEAAAKSSCEAVASAAIATVQHRLKLVVARRARKP